MRELIEPPVNTGAYPDPPQIADRRLYNKAGIRIHIAVTTVIKYWRLTTVYTPTVTTQNGTSLTTAQVNSINAALKQQTIYDRREGQNVDLTTLDLAAVRSTLNAAAGFNNIIYIDQTDANGNIAMNDPQGIRLDNGSTLPKTALPWLVRTRSISRAITTLKTRKRVALQPCLPTRSRFFPIAGTTRIPVIPFHIAGLAIPPSTPPLWPALLPSGWTNFNSVPAYGYSGGLNNFPRFLEDWTNKTFTYTGSMIELFNSQIAIGE